MASAGEQVLERGAVWGTLGELYRSYFLEILYNFGFSRGGPRCPPRPRIWRPRPIRKHRQFSKAPLRGAETLLPGGRAKKNSPVREKMGSNPGSNPVSAHFGSICLPISPCASFSAAEF